MTLPVASIADASADESAGTISFTVTLDKAPGAGNSVSVDYATADGTATAGSDYTASTGTLTISNNKTTGTIDVPITDDALDEPDETFDITLSNPSGATIGTGTATGTILDDDAAPVASIADASADESAGTISFTVTLDKAPGAGNSVSVDYATADGTATAGSDYTASTGTLTISNNKTTGTIDVPITDDSNVEGDENFYVDLTGATDATIDGAADRGEGTIIDDDAPEMSIDNVSDFEDAGTFVFTVTLSDPAPSGGVSVDYATADGTATAGSDYTATSGTLMIPEGSSSGTISVDINDDSVDEPANETFEVNLSNPSGATINDGQGIGTIRDNDNPGGGGGGGNGGGNGNGNG